MLDTSRLTAVQEGVSQKHDIYTLFGQPHEVIYLAKGDSIWEYYNSEISMSGKSWIPVYGLIAGGSNVNARIVSFYFNSEGRYSKRGEASNSYFVNDWDAITNAQPTKVKEIAFDLIKLYAQRKSQVGFAFSPDNYLQTELEASFIYEDTPD